VRGGGWVEGGWRPGKVESNWRQVSKRKVYRENHRETSEKGVWLDGQLST
jgi:hypothetical protein